VDQKSVNKIEYFYQCKFLITDEDIFISDAHYWHHPSMLCYSSAWMKHVVPLIKANKTVPTVSEKFHYTRFISFDWIDEKKSRWTDEKKLTSFLLNDTFHCNFSNKTDHLFANHLLLWQLAMSVQLFDIQCLILTMFNSQSFLLQALLHDSLNPTIDFKFLLHKWCYKHLIFHAATNYTSIAIN